MRAHMYKTPTGIVAIADDETARALVRDIQIGTPMFDGKAVPTVVIRGYLKECGGTLVGPRGVRRYKPVPKDRTRRVSSNIERTIAS